MSDGWPPRRAKCSTAGQSSTIHVALFCYIQSKRVRKKKGETFSVIIYLFLPFLVRIWLPSWSSGADRLLFAVISLQTLCVGRLFLFVFLTHSSSGKPDVVWCVCATFIRQLDSRKDREKEETIWIGLQSTPPSLWRSFFLSSFSPFVLILSTHVVHKNPSGPAKVCAPLWK